MTTSMKLFNFWHLKLKTKAIFIYLGSLVVILAIIGLTFNTDFLRDKKAENLERIDVSRYKKNGKWTIPPESVIPYISWANLSKIYHEYLETIQYECENILRMGKVTDGGWDICADEPYRPTKDGVVYSFGINFDFSFDDDISKKYKIPVFSFDPSMNTKSHRRSDLVRFEPLGIAGSMLVTDNGWELAPLSYILNKQGHKKEELQVLKMDIEEWEWKVLPELIESNSLSHVKQLLLEFHSCLSCKKRETPMKRYRFALKIFHDLYQLGFRIFWTHNNPNCKYTCKFTGKKIHSCHEVDFVKVS